MLKTAIYGLLRVTFDLLQGQLWWWGVAALALGLVTALFGVVFAAVQSDMKRLLAYSSIENIGIIAAGIGLAILFRAYDKPLLAAISLTAVLYHCLNHAFFKSLLFLATGSVLHATHERSLGKLGGLIHRMPWVAWLALVGTLAIAGLPPLNGFVSEWLLLQAFLFTPSLPQSFVNMLVPVATAALVLAVALAAYVMVKFYGIIFLGRPREANLAYAHDAGKLERAALVYLAAGCVLLGVFPVSRDHAHRSRSTGARRRASALTAGSGSNWLLLAPINADRSSYSPLIVLVVIVATVLLTIQVVHRLYHGRVRRAPPWDCGFPAQTPRMQDTAEGFGQPIRTVFEPFFRMERHLPSPFDTKPYYAVKAEDHLWYWLYLPIARGAEWLARIVGATSSRGASPSTSRTASSRCSRCCCSSCDEALTRPAAVPLPAAAGRHRADPRAAARRLGEPVPRVAAEQAARRRCSCPTARSASCSSRTPSSRTTRRRIFRLTPYIVFGAMTCAAAIVPSLATDLPFAQRGRRDRAGRPVRAGAGVHVAGGDGHRHRVRHARRAPRHVRRLPGRARAPDGAVHRLADLRLHVAARDRRHARAPRDRASTRASRSPASRSRWCRSRRTRASRSTTRRRTSSSP